MVLDERSKPNYQPWREEAFKSDLKVWKMTHLQRWMYRSLLQHAFVCTQRPRLPNDDEELWMMADCESIEQWNDNKSMILKMFDVVTVEDKEVLSHPRLEEDWTNLQSIREKRVEAGRKGGSSSKS